MMTTRTKQPPEARPLRIGIVVPHIFMHRDILPHVIFSPAPLALSLADGLTAQGHHVSLFTPGPVATAAHNITADLTGFEHELALRGDTYMDLLRKHPLTFTTLARQVQSALLARAYALANTGGLDVVHVYTNEEELGLAFAELCRRPVVFTHHDPYNFLARYRAVFPHYAHVPMISLSMAQRAGMPADTNWVGNIYHGLPETQLTPVARPANNYVAYFGRIIEPKGVHLAIQAVRQYNRQAARPLQLRLAGKHYSGQEKDTYWQRRIAPELDDMISYAGFIPPAGRRAFLGNARALLVPSAFSEPFGMVVIEALACGTPVIALDSGSLPELLTKPATGTVVAKVQDAAGTIDEAATAARLAEALEKITTFDRTACRRVFAERFTAARMCREHEAVYRRLTALPDRF